jgi:hypothetical protein
MLEIVRSLILKKIKYKLMYQRMDYALNARGQGIFVAKLDVLY